MPEQEPIYDSSVADVRFQLEVLALRWGLVALYALLVFTDMISVDMAWFAASEGLLVVFHIYYTWYTWHELTRGPLPPATAYAIPFLDAVAVTLALIAVGDPLHPIWTVYFFISVAVAFFFYPIARFFVLWLLVNYLAVGLGLQARGVDVPVAQMGVGAIILLAGMYNLASYTGSERRLRGRISEAARTDPLTSLLNRRGLQEVLGKRVEEAIEAKKGLAVFMLDVDRFKRYNDQYGHMAADGILEQLGEVLQGATREPDLVARYGGDEFVIIVPDVAPEDAVLLAERLCKQVARLGLCTVSIGVSESAGQELSAEELLKQADSALLVAKQAGRNCVKRAAVQVQRAA